MKKQKYNLKPSLILLGLCMWCTAGEAQAQAPELKWATHIGGTGTEISNSLKTDSAGNIYIAGYFGSLTDFDPLGGTNDTISPNGGTDAFVSKMDADGHLIWVRRFGDAGNEQALAVALDDTGNVYVTGFFNNTTDFDPSPAPADTFFLRTNGGNDIFVTKLDANGNFVWATSMGGSSNDRGLAIVADGAGNTYVTGAFNSLTAYFGPDSLLTTRAANGTSASIDAFVCRVNASGDIAWSRKIGGKGADQGSSITTDLYGNIFITGNFVDTSSFGGVMTLNGNGSNNDCFVTRMDTAGNFLWAKGIGGPEGGDRGEGIITDNEGNLYITGGFRGTANFDPNGTYLLTGTPYKHLALDPTAAPVDDIFVAKWDTAGNFIWAKQHGGGLADYGKSVTLDKAGFLHIVGDFSDTIDIDTFTLSSQGSVDVYILKMDTAGHVIWAGNIGGNSLDHSNDIAAGPLGNVYVTGRYQSHLNVDFDPGTGIFPMPSTLNAAGTSGTIDAFVMRLYACINISMPPSIQGPDSICPGSTYVYSVKPVPGAASYEWTFPSGWIISGSGSSRTAIVNNTIGNITLTANGLCDTGSVILQVALAMPGVSINVNGDTLSTAGKSYDSWQWYKDGHAIDSATNPFYIVPDNGHYSVVVTGPNGCTDSASYSINNISVASVSKENHARIYPNPVTDILYIEASGMALVNVKGLDGRILLQHRLSGKQDKIDISGLIPGIYLVEIAGHSGEQLLLEKLVKTGR